MPVPEGVPLRSQIASSATYVVSEVVGVNAKLGCGLRHELPDPERPLFTRKDAASFVVVTETRLLPKEGAQQIHVKPNGVGGLRRVLLEFRCQRARTSAPQARAQQGHEASSHARPPFVARYGRAALAS